SAFAKRAMHLRWTSVWSARTAACAYAAVNQGGNMRKKNPVARRAASVSIPLILAIATQAHAQTAPAEPAADEGLQEVTVTGSRIQRPSGFGAPQPITVIGADRLEQRAITNIGDALNELPSFRASTNPATQQNTNGSIGARVLDLRGLGA